MVHQRMIKWVVMWLHILVVSAMSYFNVNFNTVFKTITCAFVGE